MAEIARLCERDWPIYRDVRLASLADSPSAFGSRVAEERDRTDADWRARLAARTQFVARERGRSVGTVGSLIEEDGTVELVSMWVAPDARGTGVADLLIDAVVTDAQGRGCRRIALWVAVGNEPAERLYARHSFERTGRTQPIDDDDPARGVEFEMTRVDRP
ncbi:MAG: GNAT family N-acetyltransferase [Actinomycetota bacterium]